jgi:short-subunit dehydrogenase
MLAEVGAQIRKSHGSPTVLVNNAGMGRGDLMLEEDEALIKRTLEVNLLSHFLMIREFLPDIIKANHGHVVTIASMSSFVVPAQMVDYAVTKAGVLAFHEGLASELKHRYNAPKVRTTVVHPTWVRTPLIEELTKQDSFKSFLLEPETVRDAVVKQLLSGKGAQIILPERMSFFGLAGIRGWPSWLQETVRNTLGKELSVKPTKDQR